MTNRAYEYYQPTTVTLCSLSPFVPPSATHLFLKLPSFDPPPLFIQSLPHSITHLHFSCYVVQSEQIYSFFPNITHLNVDSYFAEPDMGLNLPSSLKKLCIDLPLDSIGPTVLEFPSSITHLKYRVPIGLSEHPLPHFPSSLKSLELINDYNESVVVGLPPTLSSLTLSENLSVHSYPPNLVHLTHMDTSLPDIPLPSSLTSLTITDTEYDGPIPPSLKKFSGPAQYIPSLPSSVSHLTIDYATTDIQIPSNITHLTLNGGEIPPLSSSITHLILKLSKTLQKNIHQILSFSLSKHLYVQMSSYPFPQH